MIGRVLGDDVPEGAQEVTQDQDEQDKAEHSEDVHYVDLVHNLVVIFAHWLHSWVLFNAIIQAPTVELFEQTLEFLRV